MKACAGRGIPTMGSRAANIRYCLIIIIILNVFSLQVGYFKDVYVKIEYEGPWEATIDNYTSSHFINSVGNYIFKVKKVPMYPYKRPIKTHDWIVGAVVEKLDNSIKTLTITIFTEEYKILGQKSVYLNLIST